MRKISRSTRNKMCCDFYQFVCFPSSFWLSIYYNTPFAPDKYSLIGSLYVHIRNPHIFTPTVHCRPRLLPELNSPLPWHDFLINCETKSEEISHTFYPFSAFPLLCRLWTWNRFHFFPSLSSCQPVSQPVSQSTSRQWGSHNTTTTIATPISHRQRIQLHSDVSEEVVPAGFFCADMDWRDV